MRYMPSSMRVTMTFYWYQRYNAQSSIDAFPTIIYHNVDIGSGVCGGVHFLSRCGPVSDAWQIEIVIKRFGSHWAMSSDFVLC